MQQNSHSRLQNHKIPDTKYSRIAEEHGVEQRVLENHVICGVEECNDDRPDDNKLQRLDDHAQAVTRRLLERLKYRQVKINTGAAG